MGKDRQARWWVCSGVGFGLFILLAMAPQPAMTSEGEFRQHPPPFSSSPLYQPYVDFWIRIFSVYRGNQVIVHDAKEPWNVIKILTFENLNPDTEHIPDAFHEYLKHQRKAIEQTLLDLHREGARAATRSQLHRWLWSLYGSRRSHNPDIFKELTGRIRMQWGMRDAFIRSLRRMVYYQPSIERIIRRYGAPHDLVYLPLLESGYNPYAGSYAGALGLWQFMRSAARKHGLIVGRYIDQRFDPILATGAAMRYLLDAYRRFHSWPLAVTSYNHGVRGIERALNEFGQTPWDIILTRYEGPHFGFASRNFYAEFLAVRYLARNREVYFPDLNLENGKRWRFQDVVLDRTLPVQSLPSRFHVPTTVFLQYNPQFLLTAFLRNVRIRKGTRLRLPEGTVVAENRDFHIIRPGETLRGIARVYRVSLRDLQAWNPDLQSRRLIPGQKIRVAAPELMGSYGGRSP